MADDADRTEERAADFEAQRFRAFGEAAKHRDLMPNGKCHYCAEDVANDQIFCDPADNDCSKDWAYEQQRKRVRGA
jgi:hypothetical protein